MGRLERHRDDDYASLFVIANTTIHERVKSGA